METSYGKEHPNTRTVRRNYEILLRQMKGGKSGAGLASKEGKPSVPKKQAKWKDG